MLTIEKISSRTFVLITNEDASLEDIIKQGTGNFSRIMTHGDLSPDNSRKKVQGIKGVRLVPSDDLNDTQFTIQLGKKSKTRDSEHWEETVVLYDNNGVKVELAGEINLEIQVNTQISFGLLSGLEGFKFETMVQADEQLEFIASGELEEMTSFPIVENEFPISNWNIGGECGLKPAKIHLTGNHVHHVQSQGSGEIIQRQYTIQNNGNFELDWEI